MKITTYIFAFAAILVSLSACNNDDDNSSSKRDDNGTGITNNGGDGNTILNPNTEKSFISETVQILESYVNASEFEEMTKAGEEINRLSDDDGVFDDLIALLANTTATRSHSYNYYNKVVTVSNAKGKYSADYNSREWTKVSDTGDLELTYTDKHGATWVATASAKGDLGNVYVEEEYYWEYEYLGNYNYHYTDNYNYIYVTVPSKVTAKLTRNGVEKVKVDININSFDLNGNGEKQTVNVMSHINGNAEVKVTPAADTYKISSTFNYKPNTESSIKAEITKNNILLISSELSAHVITKNNEVEDGSAKATLNILNRLQTTIACDDISQFGDAVRSMDNNKYKEIEFKKNLTIANNYIDGYICNNGGSAKQATVKLSGFSKKKWGNTMYNYKPVLLFADNTTYSFEEYFTESAFKTVIDNFEKLTKDFEKLSN